MRRPLENRRALTVRSNWSGSPCRPSPKPRVSRMAS